MRDKKQFPSYQGHSLFATVILLLSVVVLLLIYVWRTHILTRQQCYTELSVSTKAATEDLDILSRGGTQFLPRL